MTDAGSPNQSEETLFTAVAPLRKTSRFFKYRAIAVWLTGFGVLGLVVFLGYRRYGHSEATPAAVPLYTVERSTVELTVASSGTLALGGQQTLQSPKNEATVEQVLVDVRSQVAAGQPLVVLRERDQELEVRSQQVEIQKIQLQLARDRERVAEVQERVNAATERYQESQQLLAQGFIAEDDVRQDQTTLDSTHSDLKDAQLTVTKTELDLKTASERLLLLEQQLNDRVVSSPIDGVVLDVQVSPGQAIATETGLLTLGDPSQEIVDLQLSTLEAAKVSINQAARVRAIGPNAQDYDGRVVALAPQALSAGNGGNSQEGQARVTAQIRLDTASQTLIPGSFVSVEIITEQQQNVLVVPPEAIQRDGEQPYVWMRNQKGNAL